jgi:ATP-dependent Clp protease ATP-binding subunit ClpC
MFERFTDQAHGAVVFAQEEARQLNHDHVGTEHVLAGLLREDRGAAAQVLGASGVTLDAVRERIETIVGHGQAPPRGHIPFTPRAKRASSSRCGRQSGWVGKSAPAICSSG